MRRGVVVAICAAVAAGVLATRPAHDAPSRYVGSARCLLCHAEEYARWQGSHHAAAMQPASARTVLGDFDGATLVLRGKTWRFFRRGDAFVVTAEGPDGALHDYDVADTFGVDPLQQYLVAFPGGRLQALSVAWDTRAKRWFALPQSEDVAPGDWLHWTRPGQSWNAMCADCHSTQLEKRYDAARDTYATTFSEISVGCEACHGPGSRHVAAPDVAMPVASRRGREMVERCAACHARRAQFADQGAADQPFLDRYRPALLSVGEFFPDGQIQNEDFEVNAFWQSKMYSKGVACNDCHDVHSGRLRARGNALCTRCHDASFDTPAHYRHASVIDGKPNPAAQCPACHMPSRSYMVVHARRDHSLRVPRPDLSEHDDSPNACAQTGCHDQRSPAWIASAFRSVWGDRDRPPHWGTILAAGRRGDAAAPDQLATLALDDSRPAIVRASALELLGGRASSRTERLLDDPETIVRWAAASYLAPDPARLARLCDDRVRAVRMAAAARLADAPACAHALEEYVASQGYAADMPSGPYNLGNLYVQLGRAVDAEAAYRRALAIDDKLVPAAVNLALLVVRDGRDAEAERLLRAALVAQPHVAVAEFNLGLLLAERGDRRGAETALRDALADDPTLAAAAYNLGVLVRDDHPAEARELFRRAARLRPDEARYVSAAAQP